VIESSALYLDLLKRCVTNCIYEDPAIPQPWESGHDTTFDANRREHGGDWPAQAHTMIGLRRLRQIETLLTDVLLRNVPGDVIEAGVGRGGATIFMRGVLAVHGERLRKVLVADSFQGLPHPSEPWLSDRSYRSEKFVLARQSKDRQRLRSSIEQVAVGTSLEDVRRNFARYGLLDQQIVFIPGWFHESLVSVPPLACVRIDADLYDSTMHAIEALYPRLSAGGYVVIDDYYVFEECRAAVDDYLAHSGESPRICSDDGVAAYWMKETAEAEGAAS
jgi:hypothetical protein